MAPESESKPCKPSWWQLYLVLPVMAGLLILEQVDPLAGLSSEFADIGIIGIAFGLMLVWMWRNEGLIARYELDQQMRRLREYTAWPEEEEPNWSVPELAARLRSRDREPSGADDPDLATNATLGPARQRAANIQRSGATRN